MKLTSIKTVILGSKVKFLHFDPPISYDFENLSAKNRHKVGEDKEPDPQSMEASARKAKARLKSLVLCNAWLHLKRNGQPYKPQFPTFTFNTDVVDLETAHKVFRKFIKRLNYQVLKRTGQKLVYIAVPEFQKDRDFYGRKKPLGGRVHYHVIFFNLPRIQNIHAFLAEVWGEGYIWNKTIHSAQHLANYVAKYISKDLENKHIKYKKRYLVSRCIKRPVKIYDQELGADFCNHISSLGNYQTKESDYTSIDGRQVHEIEMTFPDGFDLAKEALGGSR